MSGRVKKYGPKKQIPLSSAKLVSILQHNLLVIANIFASADRAILLCENILLIKTSRNQIGCLTEKHSSNGKRREGSQRNKTFTKRLKSFTSTRTQNEEFFRNYFSRHASSLRWVLFCRQC
jgi:hypothetical protein